MIDCTCWTVVVLDVMDTQGAKLGKLGKGLPLLRLCIRAVFDGANLYRGAATQLLISPVYIHTLALALALALAHESSPVLGI